MKSSLFSMLFVAAFAMLFAGCSDTPADIARKHHKAVIKNTDAGEAIDYAVEDLRESTKSTVKKVKSREEISFGDAKIDGETAKVTVMQFEGETWTKKEYQLVKTGGKWKISKIVAVKD